MLNDYSGSPRVFGQLLQMLSQNGYAISLFTSRSSEKGFLSDIPNIDYHFFNYRWSQYTIITFIRFFVSQALLFFRIYQHLDKGELLYINTILPFGAALAGKVKGARLVYHIHETSVSPLLFKRFLFFMVKMTASEVIYVSQDLANKEPLPQVSSHVVYNAVAPEFFSEGASFKKSSETRFTVLMLSSLKRYKGIYEFVALAKHFPEFQFILVLNTTQKEVDEFDAEVQCPSNCSLYASQSKVVAFYKKAHLVLNLSHPDKWVETFGLTAVEAMCFGIPVIVPPVGGIAELVSDGLNGYRIDVRNFSQLTETIQQVHDDKAMYKQLSEAAKKKSMEFQPHAMYEKIEEVISKQYE